MTWRGRLVQSCTCSKLIYFKCSLLSFSEFKTLGSSPSWSFPLLHPSFSWKSHTYQHCDFLLGLSACVSQLFNLPSPLLMQNSRPILAFKSLILLPPTSYLLLLAPSPTPHVPGCLSTFPASSSPLTLSKFFNRMLGVFEPGALNFYTLTLFVSRNLTLIHLPLSGSLDFLPCDQIAPTPGQAFLLLMPCTLATASSLSSGRAYPFLDFLLALSLH